MAMRRLLPLLSFAALGACGDMEGGGNPAFRATGEVIAMSGGDGGAANACAACHGLQGEGDGRLTPRLAGLDAGYMHRQLDDYANGRREHAQMRTVVRRLSGEDRARVSAYYAALPVTGRLEAPAELYAAKCASCHGARGEGTGPGNPPLAGQPPAYVAGQVEAWRSGKRRDPMGVMLAVSRALAPEEIDRLAGRGAPQPPPARPRPAPEASR